LAHAGEPEGGREECEGELEEGLSMADFAEEDDYSGYAVFELDQELSSNALIRDSSNHSEEESESAVHKVKIIAETTRC
jgi:hypothetical protein